MNELGDEMDNLLLLSPFDFEKAATQLIVKLGFRAEQTRLSRDGGVDIWAEDEKPFGAGRIIVQCKRYASSNLVGEPVVRELFGLIHAHGVNKGVLLTTSDFTADARRFAAGKPIELINGAKLVAVLKSVGQPVLKPNDKTPESGFHTATDPAATMDDFFAWSARRPKPYALGITMTLTEFWGFFWSDWGQNNDAELGTLLFYLDYHAAAYHLLEDAMFRPEENPATVRALTEQRVREIASVIREKMLMAKKTALYEADEYLARGYGQNRSDALGLCESDLESLCVKFWWKKHGSPFMLPSTRP